MFAWVHGRPTLLLRERDLARWPGHELLRPNGGRFARVERFEGSSILLLREHEMTTVVPLELGGVMLVTAVYCDGDHCVARHLDLVPLAGWETLPERFHAEDDRYVVFDGSLRGEQLFDPALEREILERHGGVLDVELAPGEYEVETLGPWRPDDRTELWLTRLVRAP